MFSISLYAILPAILALAYAIFLLGVYIKELQRRSLELEDANRELSCEVDEKHKAIEKRTSELERANIHMQKEMREKEEARNALREIEDRYALVASASNDGIWDWDLVTNKMTFSPRWKAMIGYEEDEIGHRPDEWFERIHVEDLPKVREAIASHLRGDTEHMECEYRLRNQSGLFQWMHARGLAVRDKDGRAVRMAGSQADTTVRKETEEQLMYNAFHDGLTGLPNRMVFMEHLQKSVMRRKRNRNYHFAVLFLDLDKFKNINDSFGHMIGDELLESVAARLLPLFRRNDTFARLGGDEFALLLDDIKDVEYASQIADHIHKELSSPFFLKGVEVFVSTSIGIALGDFEYDLPEDMMRDADIAMHRAKLSGRACYMLFDKNMHTNLLSRLQLETDLHLAIEKREFFMAYQPIFSLATGRVVGFEGLLRWAHPKRGVLLPGEFISVAEETGLINVIGGWALKEGCRQMRAWQDRFPSDPPLSMSINVSGKQFLNQKFIRLVRDVLKETSLDTDSLILEMTESHLLADSEIISSRLKDLRALNVKIHIDDFGTGYSSLAYLQQFLISALKIDRSFVQKISRNKTSPSGPAGESSGIIQAILALAHNLNLDVIAEGVETEEHVSVLRELSCPYVQGFYFAPALTREEAECLLEEKLRPACV
jgi:diguanylate cyclase (GGDEF)-like protein/PAS domain S-box-containing protein